MPFPILGALGLGLAAYNSWKGGKQAKKGEKQQEQALAGQKAEYALGDPLRQKARFMAMQDQPAREDLSPMFTDSGNPYATQLRSQMGPRVSEPSGPRFGGGPAMPMGGAPLPIPLPPPNPANPLGIGVAPSMAAEQDIPPWLQRKYKGV